MMERVVPDWPHSTLEGESFYFVVKTPITPPIQHTGPKSNTIDRAKTIDGLL